jgi:hypothetical protein
VFPTALITVVGLSANAGRTISISTAMLATDSQILRLTESPQCKVRRWMTLAVSAMLTARARNTTPPPLRYGLV